MRARETLMAALGQWLEVQPEEKILTWFRTGVVGVVLDKRPPHECFTPGQNLVGGEDHSTWQDDVLDLVTSGTQQLNSKFQFALSECFKHLPAFADDSDAPVPKIDHETLVLTYLWFARNVRMTSVGSSLGRLCFVVHPESTDVFEACLWTWRLLAPLGPIGAKFVEKATADARFKKEFNPSVFIGLCMEGFPNLDTKQLESNFQILPGLIEQVRLQQQPDAIRAFQEDFKKNVANKLPNNGAAVEVRFFQLNTAHKAVLFGVEVCSPSVDVRQWLGRPRQSISKFR